MHCSCATRHQSVRLLGGVGQPWDWVTPALPCGPVAGHEAWLVLGLGRAPISEESGATEAVRCEVRVGEPAQETCLQVQNELPRGCAENNGLCCLFLPFHQKGRHNSAFPSCEGKEKRLKEVLSLQAGEQYTCHLRNSQCPLINEGGELKTKRKQNQNQPNTLKTTNNNKTKA